MTLASCCGLVVSSGGCVSAVGICTVGPVGVSTVSAIGVSASVRITTSVAPIATSTTDSEFLAIILSTTLSDRHKDGLMVGGRTHSADTIVASWKSTGNSGAEKTFAVTSIVDTLEEGKLDWVWCDLRREGVSEILDSDVSVADDLALGVEVLGSRIVGRLRIGEGAGLEAGGLDLDVEVGIGGNILGRRWVHDDGGYHLGGCWDLTHHDTVTGTAFGLETVGERLTVTEVDEVCFVTGRC